MCFFPRKIKYKDTFGNVHNIECGCGTCPECLSRRARQWALRGYYESIDSPSMMVTLTYDSYIYNSFGRVIGERVASDIRCNKRDVQLFIKSLRKHVAYHYGRDVKLKYIATAERGKRTNRPHYHLVIFGFQFPDVIFYKMSKRGSRIYKSETLNKLWKKGICTVDSINVTPAVVRYCTKYISKDYGKQDSDTFMLFSRDIGTNGLLRDFNGISYIIDGQEYPIPRLIWNKYLLLKSGAIDDHLLTDIYNGTLIPFSFRYVKYKGDMEKDLTDEQIRLNDFYSLANLNFRRFRERDSEYRAYIEYWNKKIETISIGRADVVERIRQLPNDKYFSYKNACLSYFNKVSKGFKPYFIPRETFSMKKLNKPIRPSCDWDDLARSSRHIAPNDTNDSPIFEKLRWERWYAAHKGRFILENEWKNPLTSKKFLHKLLTSCSPCVKINSQGSFGTQTTMYLA